MISPSAQSRYNRCKRAWWYTYVKKLRSPPTAALRLGTLSHTAAEDYILRGTPPSGEAAQRVRGVALGYLGHLRGLGGVVESTVDVALPLGAPDRLFGRVDWYHASASDAFRPHGQAPWGDGPVVIDHKTTSDPRHWGTPESLAEDGQLLSYAWGLADNPHPYAGRVLVGHLYLPPAPHESTLVLGWATPEARQRQAEALARASLDLQHIRQIDNPEAVPHRATSGACEQFGGCEHAVVCSAAPAWIRARKAKLQPPPPEPEKALTKEQIETQNAVRARLGWAPLPVPATKDAAPSPLTTATPEGQAVASAVAAGLDVLAKEAPTPEARAFAAGAAAGLEVLAKGGPVAVAEAVGTAVQATTLAAVTRAEPAHGVLATTADTQATVARERPPTLPEDVVRVQGEEDASGGRPTVPVDETPKRRKRAPKAAQVVGAPAQTFHVEHRTVEHFILVGCTSVGAAPVDAWLAPLAASVEWSSGHYLTESYNSGPKTLAALAIREIRAGNLALPPILEIPRGHALEAYAGLLAHEGAAMVVRGVA